MLSDPFRELGAWRSSVETQHSGPLGSCSVISAQGSAEVGERTTGLKRRETCTLCSSGHSASLKGPGITTKSTVCLVLLLTVFPFQFLLDSPSCWCVHAEALRLRCLNEKDRSRTVERSMMQLDNLVELVTAKQDDQESSRLDLFYAVRPPPIWILQVSHISASKWNFSKLLLVDGQYTGGKMFSTFLWVTVHHYIICINYLHAAVFIKFALHGMILAKLIDQLWSTSVN